MLQTFQNARSAHRFIGDQAPSMGGHSHMLVGFNAIFRKMAASIIIMVLSIIRGARLYPCRSLQQQCELNDRVTGSNLLAIYVAVNESTLEAVDGRRRHTLN